MQLQIALTFDACPNPQANGFDARIARVLVDSSVAATIFVSGRWVERHPRDAALLAASPLFEIGTHSFSHPHMRTLSDDSLRWELRATSALLQKLGIPHVPLYRPPFGETTRRIDSIARSLGIRTVMFDIASGDPDSSFHRERLVRSVVDRARNGSIVVLHINGRGWHTAEALPEIIGRLRAKGYVFVKAGAFSAPSGGDSVISRR